MVMRMAGAPHTTGPRGWYAMNHGNTALARALLPYIDQLDLRWSAGRCEIKIHLPPRHLPRRAARAMLLAIRNFEVQLAAG